MSHTTSTLTVEIGSADCTCRIGWSYCPGEPEVRYYADGSGHPGCPPSFDSVDSVELIEVQFCDDPFVGNEYRGPDFYARNPVVKDIIENMIFDRFADGSRSDELFDYVDDSDYEYYRSEDDYV